MKLYACQLCGRRYVENHSILACPGCGDGRAENRRQVGILTYDDINKMIHNQCLGAVDEG